MDGPTDGRTDKLVPEFVGSEGGNRVSEGRSAAEDDHDTVVGDVAVFRPLRSGLAGMSKKRGGVESGVALGCLLPEGLRIQLSVEFGHDNESGLGLDCGTEVLRSDEGYPIAS